MLREALCVLPKELQAECKAWDPQFDDEMRLLSLIICSSPQPLFHDLGPYAWRTFAYPWDAAAGTHMLASRATDRNGSVQPEIPPQNERGYGHNGWRDPAVTVEIA